MAVDRRARKRSWDVPVGSEVVPGRRVIRRLGGGRRTEVYRCTDEGLDEPVVVKVLRPGRTGDRDVAVLRREAATLGALDHPGFPRLVDADLEADPAWLAMSPVDGPHLSKLVREQGTLDLAQGLSLLHDVADALAHLHERGRVHLDVKPTNIVMGDRPVLLDLGASRTTERAATVRPGLGTITYLSPEQADPPTYGAPGPSSDVFGLGVTIVRAMTGTNPYVARRHADGAVDEEALARECRTRAATLPAPLADLVVRCLSLSAAERPTAAELVARCEDHDPGPPPS